MKIPILFLILFLSIFASVSALAGDWSEPRPITNDLHLDLVYQWRLFAADSANMRDMIEWVFINQSRSTVTFTYRIVSDRDDSFVGRITLPPRARRIAGWLFRGYRIVDVIANEFEPVKNE